VQSGKISKGDNNGSSDSMTRVSKVSPNRQQGGTDGASSQSCILDPL
jgi:hypothetical protein